MKKLLLFCIVLLLASTICSCEKSEKTDIPSNDATKEKQENIVNKNVIAPDETNDINEETALKILSSEISVEDFYTKESATVYSLGYGGTPSRYTLVDLDGDGMREFIVENSPSGDTAVIHMANGKYIAYYVPLRAINQLKKDGTMSWSNSAFESGVRRICFVDGEIGEEKTVVYNTYDGLFTINGEEVSEEEAYDAIVKQDEKEDVEWTDIDPEFIPDFKSEFCNLAEGIWTMGDNEYAKDFVRFKNGEMTVGTLHGHSWYVGDVVNVKKSGTSPVYEVKVYSPEYYDEMNGHREETTLYYKISINVEDKKLIIESVDPDYYFCDEYEYFAKDY